MDTIKSRINISRFAAVWVLMITGLASPVLSDDNPLLLATTTSTDHTGLLDYLSPKFTEDTGITLKWAATGTGKALKLGENCDADVLLVHAPEAEKTFVENSFGINRREIMHNDFVIIGPKQDPAGIKGKTVFEAFNKIREENALFMSRGDNSGTHKKEIQVWRTMDKPVPEMEKWYAQTGQGMLPTLHMAAEKGGYTLTDQGTYIKYEHRMDGNPELVILVENDDILINRYSVLEVNPKRCNNAQNDKAAIFSDWMAGEKAQEYIGEFRLMGRQLFKPNAK